MRRLSRAVVFAGRFATESPAPRAPAACVSAAPADAPAVRHRSAGSSSPLRIHTAQRSTRNVPFLAARRQELLRNARDTARIRTQTTPMPSSRRRPHSMSRNVFRRPGRSGIRRRSRGPRRIQRLRTTVATVRASPTQSLSFRVDYRNLKIDEGAHMAAKNPGGWKTRSRGHKYRGAGPCPICYPGSRKRLGPSRERPRPAAHASPAGGDRCLNRVRPANIATRNCRRIRSKRESVPMNARSARTALNASCTVSARIAAEDSRRGRSGHRRTGRVTTFSARILRARLSGTDRLIL